VDEYEPSANWGAGKRRRHRKLKISEETMALTIDTSARCRQRYRHGVACGELEGLV